MISNNFIKVSLIAVFFGILSFKTISIDGNEENEKKAVEKVLTSYRDAIQNLTVENTDQLFAVDSEIYESGGNEGTYQNYKEHHLGPELKYFKSFTFNDYVADVNIDIPYAFATETYLYEIVITANKEKKREERIIQKKGIATIVLKKVNGSWKILKYHSSSRGIKPVRH